jgi:D-beta-D-heptose 7-phosphate kinase/D-beta-D-heptose 1-phosphate adenosyltransferase
MTDWTNVVSALYGRRLLVVGDVMLDEYVSGDARRICPEAPVPVIESSKRWCVPGGAANAAANAAGLGGRPVLGGVTGDDYAAVELAKAAQRVGIDTSGLVVDLSRPTTSKLRVLARGQQVTRVDTESTCVLPTGLATQLTTWAAHRVNDCDAVLLSDYGKGVINGCVAGTIISAAQKAGRPIVVDPKGTDPSRYRGATVSDTDLLAAGHDLAAELEGSVVLVTRGSDGMALFRSGRPASLLPAAPARRVYDVTGAGDTAAAALALALAAGTSVEVAARLANAAASLAVCKVGTAVVKPEELLDALLEAAPDFLSIAA